MSLSHEKHLENLLFRYAELIDSGDFEAIATLFSRAALVIPQRDAVIEGYDAILGMYSHSTRRYVESAENDFGTPLTRHVVSNVILNIDREKKTASARSSYTVFQATSELALQPIIIGRYRDEFRCESDITENDTDTSAVNPWYFSRREIYIDLEGNLAHHLF